MLLAHLSNLSVPPCPLDHSGSATLASFMFPEQPSLAMSGLLLLLPNPLCFGRLVLSHAWVPDCLHLVRAAAQPLPKGL